MIKLQKHLADLGLGSRRRIEQWIEQGRIKVNRQKATIGDRVSPSDRIEVDGKRVHSKRNKFQVEWLAYHKPEGEITTRRDPQGRTSVFSQLPRPRYGRWISVGRLDINTSGLLLFTNNGEQANYLMHPSNEVKRIYMARVHGKLSQEEMQQLKRGIQIEEGVAKFEAIEFAGGQSNNFWYRVTLTQGHYREVRRLFSHLGHEVGRLMRIQYGEFTLPSSLKRGQWRYLEVAKHPYIKHLIEQTKQPTLKS